mmetsp:Transcript_12688/g.29160  ORF Transcript_12688/g.29160 Transcript_12688/m.29160 type:complete len:323 (-) Transcript_12688:89-1057(-)
MGRPVAADAENVRVYSQRKQDFKERLEGLLDEYTKVLVVGADNVGSNQMHQIRRALRGKALVLMGKNTMVRFVINQHAKNTGNTKLAQLSALCRENVGLVFTNEDLKEVRDLLLENKVQAPARIGAVAPNTVTIPAGPTSLEPTQTSFFQALSIATKINKGSIEILSEVELLKEGDKCGASQVALLGKLNIKPFSYGLVVEKIYDNGSVYDPSILDITNDDLKATIKAALNQVAAFSLATGFPTQAAVPHLIVNGFKNLVSVSLETDYEFEQAAKIKEILANPGAFAAAAAPAAAAGGAAPAAKAPEPEEEEEEDMGFSLFD